MNNNSQLNFKRSIFLIPSLFILCIWFIYWVEITFDFNFNKLGIYPRNLVGLRGVLLSLFIHGDTSHLFNNSVPLFVLISSLLYFYRSVAFKLLVYGGIISGFLTWLIARESFHIGASGIVYLVFSFVFFSGLIKKHYMLVALSLIIIFLYGSMIWYVLPIKDGISWEGHLAGFLTGIVFSFIYRKKGITKQEYFFKRTEFDDMFDENGNFNPPEIQPKDDKECID